MHVAFRESPRHLESSFTSRLLPCTTSRSLLGGTDINSHKFPFKRARIHRPFATPSPPPFESKGLCLPFNPSMQRTLFFLSVDKTERGGGEERGRQRGAVEATSAYEILQYLTTRWKLAKSERNARIAFCLFVFEKRGWGRRRKKELVCPIERGKKWLLRSRNLKFSLKFSKKSKTSIYR